MVRKLVWLKYVTVMLVCLMMNVATFGDDYFSLIRTYAVDEVGIYGQNDSCEFSKDNQYIIASDNHAKATDDPYKLFQSVANRSVVQTDEGLPDTVIKQRVVDINTTLLNDAVAGEAELIILNLFDDANLVAVIERTIVITPDRFTIIGTIDGVETSSFIITVNNGAVVGEVNTAGGDVYNISPSPGDIHHVKLSDPSKLPVCTAPNHKRKSASSTVSAPVDMDPNTAGDTAGDFDVLFIYTDSVIAGMGSVAAVEALIDFGVAQTNTTFQNSLVNATLTLVHSAWVDYDDTVHSGGGDVLAELEINGNGILDEVNTIRDSVCADLVVMLVNNGACGVANVPDPGMLTTDFENEAFCVVGIGCAQSKTVPHELGHLFGSKHAVPESTQGSGLFYYSHGWRWNNEQYRSMMAYSPGTRALHYSNPNVSYDGGVTGDAILADNARGFNEAAWVIANFRDSGVCDAPPENATIVAPADFATVVSINTEIIWNAGEYADSHDIYFSTDLTPTFIGNQLVDDTSYDPGPLLAGTTYYWQINAKNDLGTAVGDVWSFTTNHNPVWGANPLAKGFALENRLYSSDLSGDATDLDGGDMLTYAKVSFAGVGVDWLTIDAGGALSGIPNEGHVGVNSWIVTVTDGHSTPVNTTVTIEVFDLKDGFKGFNDFWYLAKLWLDDSCVICDGANLDGVNGVGIGDLTVFALGWLPHVVPYVIDTPQATAESIITGVGLDVGAVTKQSHESIVKDNVISSNPIAGVEVPLSASVDLLVSLGPQVDVPNVVNLQQGIAESAITDEGLVVGYITTEYHTSISFGKVISSNPVAGTTVAPESTVDLLVSDGPFPDVTMISNWIAGSTHVAVAGPYRALLFTAHCEQNGSNMSATVTYGGADMTLVRQINQGSGYRAYAGMWVLNEVGITGASSGNFAVTWNQTPDENPGYTSVFVQYADQTAVIGANDSAGQDSGATISTTSLANDIGDLVIFAGTHGKDNGSFTVNNGFTEELDLIGDSITTVTGHRTGTGSNLIPSVTYSGEDNRQVLIGAVINGIESQPAPTVNVPNVIGDPEAAAITTIYNASLTIGTNTDGYHGSIATGNVISTYPTAGTAVPEFSAVNIVVSLGDNVPVPNVIGDMIGAATAELEGLGFTVNITLVNNATIPPDEVMSQSPSGGTLTFGGAIDLDVSDGPVVFDPLEQNNNQDDKIDVKDGQKGAQSFEHGSDFMVTSVELKLSRDSDSPDEDLHFAIGTSINGGTIAGTAYDITPSSVTDTSGGSSFMNYTITFASPVGPLNGGTTYYLNFETGGNGKAYFLGYNGDSDYGDGDYFKGGSGDGKDIYFKVSGYDD